MSLFYDLMDVVVHSIHVATRAVGFLLGIHLFIVLQAFRLILDDPVGSLRSPSRRGNRSSIDPRTALEGRGRRGVHPLHLPALGPRPDDIPLPPAALGSLEKFKANVMMVGSRLHDEAVDLGEKIEANGGTPAKLLSALSLRGRLSRSPSPEPHLIKRLPPELVTHILLLAASSYSPDGIPCKVSLLSKAHHQLVVSKLYSNVCINDCRAFRHFRLTLALHNPSLGQHVKSLQIASSEFDDSGYLPGQIAEHVALGVGLEQILLSCPNLSDLYLDLFSMSALHNGTASRLERGALPTRLAAELSIPQYLALPTFTSLQHVELSVFGLDRNAVEDLRSILPRLKSLTFRWVTRGSYRPPSLRHDVLSTYDWWRREGNSNMAGVHVDGDEDEEEKRLWAPGGRKYVDLCLFAEAVDCLRKWPFEDDSQGEKLEAISIFAWPKAAKMLMRFFPDAKLANEHDDVIEWDRSMKRYAEDDGLEETWKEGERSRPSFSRLARRVAGHRPPVLHHQQQDWRPRQVSSTAPYSLETNVDRKGNALPPCAPLRIGVDKSYMLGPRRGPLEEWVSRRPDLWV